MGQVLDAVKGPAKKTGTSPGAEKQNLINRLTEMSDELSQHIATKESDITSEGDAARAENSRKVGVLRASFSLMRMAKQLLEGYDTPSK